MFHYFLLLLCKTRYWFQLEICTLCTEFSQWHPENVQPCTIGDNIFLAQWQMREIKQSLSVSLKDQLGFNWILLKSIGIGIQHSTLPFLCSHFVLNGSKISGHERYTEHRVVSDSLLAKNNPYWQNPIFVFFCIALCSIVFN